MLIAQFMLGRTFLKKMLTQKLESFNVKKFPKVDDNLTASCATQPSRCLKVETQAAHQNRPRCQFKAPMAFFVSVISSVSLLAASPCRAEFVPTEANFTKLVNSIYRAEGGARTSHPYGILAKYKHTTPRQACFNTVKNTYRRWEAAGRPGDYLTFLANRYAPVGAKNDPTGLNRNWLKNVRYFMEQS